MTWEKWAACYPFLSSRRKKVGRLRAGQPEAMERQRDVWEKAGEIKNSVEDEGRECKREVMPKSHQQLFYFWTLWWSVERDPPPHWSDLFTAPYVCVWVRVAVKERKSVLVEICIVLFSTTEKLKSANLIFGINWIVWFFRSAVLNGFLKLVSLSDVCLERGPCCQKKEALKANSDRISKLWRWEQDRPRSEWITHVCSERQRERSRAECICQCGELGHCCLAKGTSSS